MKDTSSDLTNVWAVPSGVDTSSVGTWSESDLCGFLGPGPHGGDTDSVSLAVVIMFTLLLLLYFVKCGARSVSGIVQ